jgi:peptidoglycan hydrolase CwlO-like protein
VLSPKQQHAQIVSLQLQQNKMNEKIAALQENFTKLQKQVSELANLGEQNLFLLKSHIVEEKKSLDAIKGLEETKEVKEDDRPESSEQATSTSSTSTNAADTSCAVASATSDSNAAKQAAAKPSGPPKVDTGSNKGV